MTYRLNMSYELIIKGRECWVSCDTLQVSTACSFDSVSSMRGGTDYMDISELSVGVIILSQTMIGILANFSLLYHYMFLYLTRDRLRSTDWVLMHLIIGDILQYCSKAYPRQWQLLAWKTSSRILDANWFSPFTEQVEVFVLAALPSSVSGRPSPSVPGTPDTQSLK